MNGCWGLGGACPGRSMVLHRQHSLGTRAGCCCLLQARLSPHCLLLMSVRRGRLLQAHPRRGRMHCQVGSGRLQDGQPHGRSGAALSALLRGCTACPRCRPATPGEPRCSGRVCSLMQGCTAFPVLPLRHSW